MLQIIKRGEKNKIILKIVRGIEIEEDEIIEEHNLISTTPYNDIISAVEDYISGLDDNIYYIIGETEIEKIAKTIYNKLQKTIDK